jgi:predicted transcriptional regulator
MLKSILGSLSRERILVFIAAREQGYAREISQFWKCPDRPIKRELNRLESAGVLTAKAFGRTIAYSMNPRFFLKKELLALLLKAMDAYQPDLRQNLLYNRRRPRAKGKPVRLLSDIEKKK